MVHRTIILENRCKYIKSAPKSPEMDFYNSSFAASCWNEVPYRRLREKEEGVSKGHPLLFELSSFLLLLQKK
jgi:hypothetical protein